MQEPTVGRIVLAQVDKAENNGQDHAPAIITRVWGKHADGGWTVNLRVFVDTAFMPLSRTSVQLLDERPRVLAMDRNAAWWPPRS